MIKNIIKEIKWFFIRAFAKKHFTKYIQYTNGYCETVCPFSKKHKWIAPRVSSAACACCSSFLSEDRKNKKIECLGVCDV